MKVTSTFLVKSMTNLHILKPGFVKHLLIHRKFHLIPSHWTVWLFFFYVCDNAFFSIIISLKEVGLGEN